MLIEIFADYLPFISFFIAVIVNIYLIVKKVPWWILLLGNLLIGIIMSYLGLSEYNILSLFLEEVANFIKDIGNAIF